MHVFSSLHAYIDPGTGSMLFTLAVGLLSAGYFFLRDALIKVKFAITGGRTAQGSKTKIPYVIFADDKRYWNVFKPICDEFEKRGIDVRYWTASPDDASLDETYDHVTCEFIGEGNKAFARLNMMDADICLATTPGLDVYQWKRSKDVRFYAHILHATSTAAWYRMFGLDYFDAVLLSNDYQIGEIREMEQKRGLPPKELEIVGCTYMDAMAAKLAADPAEPKREGDDAITVLLAPTWGPNGLLKKYGSEILDALISTGFDVVVRPHPQSMTSEREMMDELMAKYPEGEHFSWNFDRDNYEILKRSDIMLSDISGVIHDFALVFDKPVMYANEGAETAVYDAAWLDEPFWETPIFTYTGIPISEDQFPRMREVILDALHNPDIEKRRHEARDLGWAHRGECAVRTVDYLVKKREELLASQDEQA